jgi:HemY protein
VATAAIDAREWETARRALEPLLESRLTQRVCTLMAQIEGKQNGDAGRVREWLARAVNAPRDPAWTADGVVADEWAPVSPVTGALDAFQWRVPVEALEKPDAELIGRKLEELVELGARQEPAIPAPEVTPEPSEAAKKAETRTAAPAAPLTALAPEKAVEEPEKAKEPQQAPSADPAKPVLDAPSPSAGAQSREAGHSGEGKQTELPAAPRKPVAEKPVVKPPRMFVPPPAPDDPGPDTQDGPDPIDSPAVAYQLPLKGSA